MRHMLCAALLLAIAATTSTAQAPRKEARDLLSAADVEASLGVSPLRAIDPASRFRPGVLTKGESCGFEKVVQASVFRISVNYTDAPDPNAVLKYLDIVEKKTWLMPATSRPWSRSSSYMHRNPTSSASGALGSGR